MGKSVQVPPRALLVDKPAGPTSHDVVATCRRALGGPRTGHTGTLDPFATGLMVILVGRATRLAPFISGLDKTYLAGLRLGARSESGDPDGPITAGGPPPDEAGLRDALSAMVGESRQQVPALSAVKVDGERLYALTRRGEQVERPTRTVVVERADLVSYDPMTGHALVELRCGPGTYIRQLAADVGERLGCGAYCHELRRTDVGSLSVSGAIALDQLAPGCGMEPIEVVGHLPRVDLDDRAAADIAHGRRVQGAPPGEVGPIALAHHGELLAVAEAADGVLKPRVVLTG
ncbi:MAG: tRNA pseudouridine(55) synthase TruB [Actinobacteria bacterium]|nr:tRNA pseudouridine(55) synthase TruB [Actinomycetota bacterium]